MKEEELKRSDLINCILKGYNEMSLEIINEDNYETPKYINDYDPFTEPLIPGSILIQMCDEFGAMMAREEMDILESEYDEYLEGILEDVGTGLKLSDFL